MIDAVVNSRPWDGGLSRRHYDKAGETLRKVSEVNYG